MHFPVFFHILLLFAWVNDLTSPPAAPGLERGSAAPSGSRKSIACPLEKPPQQSQTVKLADQRRAENWPWGMPITPVRLEMRRSGDRKMSHNAAFCLGERQIRRPSGLPVLLFTDEEAGSRTRGQQCTEWSQWMLRSGSTPVIPAGTAQSIIDAAPTKHAASMLQIFPHCCVYIQHRPARKDLQTFPQWWFPSDRVTDCVPSILSLSHSKNLSNAASTNHGAL